MHKKLLFLFLLVSSIVFSQENSINELMASPNPFSNSTTIQFTSSEQQPTLFTVKNVLGKTVHQQSFDAIKGKNSIFFDRRNLISGIYIYAVQSNKDFISKRFVIK